MGNSLLWGLLALSMPSGAFASPVQATPEPLESETRPRLAPERVLFRTNLGDFVLALYADIAPRHVERVLTLARLGTYQGAQISYLRPGEIVQFLTDYTRIFEHPSVRPMRAEFSALKHKRGVVTMVRNEDPHTATGAYFWILRQAVPHFDGQYTIFGHIERGMDVIDAVTEIPIDSTGWPIRKILVHGVEILTESELSRTALQPANRAIVGTPTPPSRAVLGGVLFVALLCLAGASAGRKPRMVLGLLAVAAGASAAFGLRGPERTVARNLVATGDRLVFRSHSGDWILGLDPEVAGENAEDLRRLARAGRFAGAQVLREPGKWVEIRVPADRGRVSRTPLRGSRVGFHPSRGVVAIRLDGPKDVLSLRMFLEEVPDLDGWYMLVGDVERGIGALDVLSEIPPDDPRGEIRDTLLVRDREAPTFPLRPPDWQAVGKSMTGSWIDLTVVACLIGASFWLAIGRRWPALSAAFNVPVGAGLLYSWPGDDARALAILSAAAGCVWLFGFLLLRRFPVRTLGVPSAGSDAPGERDVVEGGRTVDPGTAAESGGSAGVGGE